VKNKFYELSRLHHPDRYAQAGGPALAEALQMAAWNNDAYKTLKNSDATIAYVLKMHGLLEDEEKYALPPAFLMEMMDINEAISDYEQEPDNAAMIANAAAMLDEQLNDWDAATEKLTTTYKEDNEVLLQIKDQYFRKKYLLRIKERIDKFAAR